MFRYKMTALTNKPIRVTRNTTNTIDHIITNIAIVQNGFKSAAIKTDLSDQFPTVFALKTNETTQKLKVSCEENIEKAKTTLHGISWDDLKKIEDPMKENTF